MNATATVIVVLVGVVVVYEILIKPQQSQGLFGNFNLGSLFHSSGGVSATRTTIPGSSDDGGVATDSSGGGEFTD